MSFDVDKAREWAGKDAALGGTRDYLLAAIKHIQSLEEQLQATERQRDLVQREAEMYKADRDEYDALLGRKMAERDGLLEQLEVVAEALREILDVTEKWTRTMTGEERLLRIDTIAKAALSKASSPATDAGAYWRAQGGVPSPASEPEAS